MADYTQDFMLFWTRYGAPKSASKQDAFKAWNQIAKFRPPQDLLLAEVSAYNLWLAEQAAKAGREYPKLHPSTFLRQARYEGFEDDAQAILRVADEHSQADLSARAKSWDGWPWSVLKAAIVQCNPDWSPGTIFENWIRQTVFSYAECEGGCGSPVKTPATIISPSQFHRDELEKRFGKVIRQAFGQDVQLTVAKKWPPKVP